VFTGLIEDKGVVEHLKSMNNASDISIRAPLVSEDAALGDSIAVNGCCLTVVKIDGPVLTFQAGEETLSRTNLGQLAVGSPVTSMRWRRWTSEITMASGPNSGSECHRT
jgi:riboflavin synthase